MANICSVKIRVKSVDDASAQKLFDRLIALQKEADTQHIGIFIGSQRYLFDSAIEYCGTAVTLDGWVKWGFSDDEFIALIKFLRKIAPVAECYIKYEECGCLLYGELQYDGTMLADCYLPEEDYPKDFDSETFYDDLEAAYQRFQEIREIDSKI